MGAAALRSRLPALEGAAAAERCLLATVILRGLLARRDVELPDQAMVGLLQRFVPAVGEPVEHVAREKTLLDELGGDSRPLRAQECMISDETVVRDDDFQIDITESGFGENYGKLPADPRVAALRDASVAVRFIEIAQLRDFGV